MRRKLHEIPKIDPRKHGGDFNKARRAWAKSITEEEADFLWELADKRIARRNKAKATVAALPTEAKRRKAS